MKPNDDDDSFTLSNGRVIGGFNSQVVGIAPGDRRLFGGYDDYVFWCGERGMIDQEPLTPSEREEISEYMIELWRQWGTLR
jgi:hypothetical protein